MGASTVKHNIKQERKQSVLVIDDNPDMLSLQRVILEMDNFEVFTAQSANEAFQLLSKHLVPDLILLDVRMGQMTGPEFITLLEQKKANIVESVPIVLMTALTEIPESRAVGYIRKGMPIEAFLAMVHHFIETYEKK